MLVVLSLRETLKITERGHLNNDILNIMVHVTDRQKINDDDPVIQNEAFICNTWQILDTLWSFHLLGIV